MASLYKLQHVKGVGKYIWKQQCINNEKLFRFQILLTCHTATKTSLPVENPKCDLIGPPNPESNLRPICFFIPKNEDPIEKKLRLKRIEVQKWNQDFWSAHNAKFTKERKEFVAANQSEASETPLSADEMSVFYKAFLDKTWKTHFYYNFEWYKRNAQLVLLDLRVKIFQFWRLLKPIKRSQRNHQKT